MPQPKNPIVKLAYKGLVSRRYHDPSTGTDYTFTPKETLLVPRSLAENLHASDPAMYVEVA